jgi:hypothetical protein
LHKRIFLYFLIPSPFARFPPFSPLASSFKVNYAYSRTAPAKLHRNTGAVRSHLGRETRRISWQYWLRFVPFFAFLSFFTFLSSAWWIGTTQIRSTFICLHLYRKPLRCKLKLPSGRDSLHPRTNMFRVKKPNATDHFRSLRWVLICCLCR